MNSDDIEWIVVWSVTSLSILFGAMMIAYAVYRIWKERDE